MPDNVDARMFQGYLLNFFEEGYRDSLDRLRFTVKSVQIFTAASLGAIFSFIAAVFSTDLNTYALMCFILPIGYFSFILIKCIEIHDDSQRILIQNLAVKGVILGYNINTLDKIESFFELYRKDVEPSILELEKEFKSKVKDLIAHVGASLILTLLAVIVLKIS